MSIGPFLRAFAIAHGTGSELRWCYIHVTTSGNTWIEWL